MTSHTPSWSADDGSVTHPDIDLLADLAEELTDPEQLPALRQHLGRCQDCSETYAALTEVRDLLGAVETPPMPADVAERIAAALAAEATRTGTSPPGPTGPTGSAAPTGAPSAPPNRRSEATGPGRRRLRRARVEVGVGALLAAFGLALLLVQQLVPANEGLSASAPAGPAAAGATPGRQPALTPAGPVYRDDLLTAQIQQLLAAAGPPKSGTPKSESFNSQPRNGEPTAPAAGAAAGAGAGADSGALPSCLPAVTGHDSEQPLAVGHGRYGPAEVTALVYPLPGQPGRLDVYLVTSACPGATVVLHRTVPSG
ncbi:hypothetical protein [Kitasatospora sp. MAP5-34]|uniref:hypothetical protein n=1 Tax=Kitasatospora sp. MAP5-34 TaxID=3035102 RepID=UPI00247399BC|nr:hypothetical protein [Kitasatospora sp. MAP5-34]MDH6576383.1 negative regulator of sigma E activity [Kitasatospora sp. MAP5-34]